MSSSPARGFSSDIKEAEKVLSAAQAEHAQSVSLVETTSFSSHLDAIFSSAEAKVESTYTSALEELRAFIHGLYQRTAREIATIQQAVWTEVEFRLDGRVGSIPHTAMTGTDDSNSNNTKSQQHNYVVQRRGGSAQVINTAPDRPSPVPRLSLLQRHKRIDPVLAEEKEFVSKLEQHVDFLRQQLAGLQPPGALDFVIPPLPSRAGSNGAFHKIVITSESQLHRTEVSESLRIPELAIATRVEDANLTGFRPSSIFFLLSALLARSTSFPQTGGDEGSNCDVSPIRLKQVLPSFLWAAIGAHVPNPFIIENEIPVAVYDEQVLCNVPSRGGLRSKPPLHSEAAAALHISGGRHAPRLAVQSLKTRARSLASGDNQQLTLTDRWFIVAHSEQGQLFFRPRNCAPNTPWVNLPQMRIGAGGVLVQGDQLLLSRHSASNRIEFVDLRAAWQTLNQVLPQTTGPRAHYLALKECLSSLRFPIGKGRESQQQQHLFALLGKCSDSRANVIVASFTAKESDDDDLLSFDVFRPTARRGGGRTEVTLRSLDDFAQFCGGFENEKTHVDPTFAPSRLGGVVVDVGEWPSKTAFAKKGGASHLRSRAAKQRPRAPIPAENPAEEDEKNLVRDLDDDNDQKGAASTTKHADVAPNNKEEDEKKLVDDDEAATKQQSLPATAVENAMVPPCIATTKCILPFTLPSDPALHCVLDEERILVFVGMQLFVVDFSPCISTGDDSPHSSNAPRHRDATVTALELPATVESPRNVTASAMGKHWYAVIVNGQHMFWLMRHSATCRDLLMKPPAASRAVPAQGEAQAEGRQDPAAVDPPAPGQSRVLSASRNSRIASLISRDRVKKSRAMPEVTIAKEGLASDDKEEATATAVVSKSTHEGGGYYRLVRLSPPLGLGASDAPKARFPLVW